MGYGERLGELSAFSLKKRTVNGRSYTVPGCLEEGVENTKPDFYER